MKLIILNNYFLKYMNQIGLMIRQKVDREMKMLDNYQSSIVQSSMKTISIAIAFWLTLGQNLGQALPPPEDTPEEILRTEIILGGRSPLDGKALTSAEYAELQAQLQERGLTANLNSDVRQIIFLLQIRKFIKTFTGISVNP